MRTRERRSAALFRGCFVAHRTNSERVLNRNRCIKKEGMAGSSKTDEKKSPVVAEATHRGCPGLVRAQKFSQRLSCAPLWALHATCQGGWPLRPPKNLLQNRHHKQRQGCHPPPRHAHNRFCSPLPAFAPFRQPPGLPSHHRYSPNLPRFCLLNLVPPRPAVSDSHLSSQLLHAATPPRSTTSP